MDILYRRSPQDRLRVRVKRYNQRIICDGLGVKMTTARFLRIQDIYKQRQKNIHTLSHHTTKRRFFVTRDSARYQLPVIDSGSIHQRQSARAFDSVSVRYTAPSQHQYKKVQDAMWQDFSTVRDRIVGFRAMRQWQISPLRLWQFSMMGAMFFGMITMSLIYKNLGQSVSASTDIVQRALTADPVTALILEGGTQAITEESTLPQGDIGVLPLAKDKPVDPEQIAFEKRARELVAGYPIEKMLPYIFQQDREVATYLIAIAKQESAWGKRVPVLNGEDCYNYWGYRAKRARMGSGGHTCFDSREDAVQTVGKRIHSLIYEYERTTPRAMLVWKCGRSCASHDPAGVERWVNTITQYRNALKREE